MRLLSRILLALAAVSVGFAPAAAQVTQYTPPLFPVMQVHSVQPPSAGTYGAFRFLTSAGAEAATIEAGASGDPGALYVYSDTAGFYKSNKTTPIFDITENGFASYVTGNLAFSFGTTGALSKYKIGYISGVGAGGAVTQLTSKATTVIVNTPTGAITTHNAALAATTTVTFTVTNSSVAATDVIALTLKSGNATAGTYQVWPEAPAAGSFKINVRNMSAGSLSEALVINYVVLKGSAN